MRKLIIFAGATILFSAPAFATILTLYSDTGIPPNTTVLTFDDMQAAAQFNGSDTTLASPPEGLQTFRTSGPSWAGWGIVNVNAADFNLTAFDSANGGVLRFWLYTNTDNLTLSLEHSNAGFDCQDNSSAHNKDCWDFTGQLNGLLNQWVLVQVPMFYAFEGTTYTVRMDDLYSPFELTSNVGATFYVDDVRYIPNVVYTTSPNPNAAPIIFNVTVNTISNQAAAANLTWSGVTLPAGWALSNQYIQMEIDSNTPGWGVQVYTDNTGSGASPAFKSAVPSGQPGSNPAGLVDSGNTSVTLPVAWSVKAATQTPAAAAPIAAEPNNNGLNGNPSDPNAFQWLYMEDAQTPAIASQNTQAFANGDPFVVIKDNVGIHFGQDTTDFGAANSPNYLFLEANFATAITPRTYQTSTLRLEFFQE